MTSENFAPALKEDFEAVYDLEDPRTYFRGLEPTAYRMPQVVAGLVRLLLPSFARRRSSDGPVKLVDFACGYGTVGALLRHELPGGMSDLYSLYATDAPDVRSIESHDRALFRARPANPPLPLRIVGIDIAARAVAYGRALGWLDEGFAEDLSDGVASDELAATLADVDLVVESGALGTVLPAAFTAMIECGNRPWFVYCPRPDADWSTLNETWARLGYVVKACSQAGVAYRKPLGEAEVADVERLAARYGLAPGESIRGGYIRVPVILARPASEAGDELLTDLAADLAQLFLDPPAA